MALPILEERKMPPCCQRRGLAGHPASWGLLRRVQGEGQSTGWGTEGSKPSPAAGLWQSWNETISDAPAPRAL